MVNHQKRKKKTEEKLQADRDYDRTKRKRTFQSNWTTEFPWVIYDGKCNIYCQPCRSCYSDLSISRLPDKGMFRKYSKGQLVTGCSNLKRSVLVDHDASQGHILATEHVKSRAHKPGESEAEKCIEKLNSAAFAKLSILFRTSHALAKKNRPFSDFNWMTVLDQLKGLHVGDTYRNDKLCRQFVRAISEVELRKLKIEIEETKFLTVISDGSTDVSIKENEAVYLRWSTQGVAKTRFLSMQHTKKADAQGIMGAIKDSFKTLHCDDTSSTTVSNYSRKVIAFAADGASVNTGKLNGVIAKMRDEWNSSIVMVQCLAHRLELTMKDTFKKDKDHKKFVALLSNLHSFYHKSPLQRSGLESAFEVSS